MSETIAYIKWGNYTSKNPNKPDILDIEVIDLEQSDSDLTRNVPVKIKNNDSWEERILPIKSHESNNSELLKKWNEAVKKKRIVVGTKLQIHTFLGLSNNNRPIRRFELIF